MTAKANSLLIIDDDDRNIFALKAVLTARGFDCLTAMSADEALRILDQVEVKTVLIDMMMPGMDGYELLKIVKDKKSLECVQFIAVTAQAMPGDKEKILAAGANDYVAKPVDVDILIQKINGSIIE